MITPKGYVHNGKYGVMVCANVVSESGAGGSMCARGPPLCPESNIRGPTCDHTLHSSLYYTQDLSSVKYSSNISEFIIVFLPTSKKGRGLTVYILLLCTSPISPLNLGTALTFVHLKGYTVGAVPLSPSQWCDEGISWLLWKY